jgi:hypothetical protein
MTRILAVLVGVLALLLLGTMAQAKPTPPPAPYTLGYEVVKSSGTVPAGERRVGTGSDPESIFLPVTVSVDCASGKVPVSGGYSLRTRGTDPEFGTPKWLSGPQESKPTDTGWKVTWPGEEEPSEGTVYAVCVNAS